MLLRTLYTHSTGVAYKHSCCSWAAILVIACTLITLLLPYFVTYTINGDLWSAQLLHHTANHRPHVAFSYRYILVAEFSGQRPNNATDPEETLQTATDEGPDLIVSSSYSFYNELTDRYQRSIALKHWTELDRHSDRHPERIHLQFSFPPPDPVQRLEHLSLYLGFDGMFEAHHDAPCAVRDIPTALIVRRQPVGQFAIGANTAATLSGTLRLHQTATVHCPFVGRAHRRTMFNARPLIPANSTDHRDYEADRIRERLHRNAMHLEFDADVGRIGVRPVAAHGNIQLAIQLDVAEIGVRYGTTVWQQLFAIWMQYLAVLVVVAVLARQLVSLAFRRRWVRAWEVVPWKKLH